MIQRKKKICKECGKEDYLFSKGRCGVCAKRSYNGLKSSKPVKNNELDTFFKKHLLLMQKHPFCVETNSVLNLGKFHLAHLLPKRNHKSVATSDDNVVYVSWEVHQDYDMLLDQHRFKEIEEKYPIIWKSLLNVLPSCQEQTKLVTKLKEYL